MKNIIYLIIFMIGRYALAQELPSQFINYQGIAQDADGNVMGNQDLDIVIHLRFVSEVSPASYSERHEITTNAQGGFNIQIGTGTVIAGVYEDLTWDRACFATLFINDMEIGTTELHAVPFANRAQTAENVSGLERIDEGNGMGWRLMGRDSEFTEAIGENALDFTLNLEGEVGGATGTLATAFGFGTIAQGNNAFATGANNLASGVVSSVFGSGNNSSGFASISTGISTTASGGHSFSSGQSTIAESLNSVAIGQFNVGGGDPEVWNDSDPLFEVGNGSVFEGRRNALTIRKSGEHVIRSRFNGITILESHNALNIRDSQSNSINILDSGFTGMLIQNPANHGLVITEAQNDGIVVDALDCGARIFGLDVGLQASGGFNNPDLILDSDGERSIGGVTLNNNAIISTTPNSNGTFILRSYGGVLMQIDEDDNSNNTFRISGSNSAFPVVEINESGDIEMGNTLQIGTETIEDTGNNQLSINASLFPDNNNVFRLGNSANRWVGVWATDGTINTSDRREKKNIKSLNYGLNEVLKLKPVSFNWKSKNIPDRKLGLIAQDVQNIIPEVVKTHEWVTNKTTNKKEKQPLERLGLYYSDLVPVLINAIQEQQKQINTLQQQVNGLSKK